MATMSVSGVISGMDWDSMIDEIISNAAKPAQVQVNKRDNLTRKKSLFEEMKVTMNSLQSSLTNLKLPSTYKAKELQIERIDTNGSYKGVLTATVNADAEVNVYDLKVNKLARAQTNRSKQITASNVSSALSDQGLTSGTMYINMAGQKVGIDITSTDSLQSIKSKINNIVKTLDIPVEVTAAVVDNRLILRSDKTGLGANSLTETLTYSLNGKNTITSFNVNNSDLGSDNFVIRNNKGNKLTYGKDYDVVNGNEIRWNPYEETDNVKLGKSVTATYKLAKGDTYESTGTYGTSEAKISGLTVKNNGTLSSRLKIQDENGNTYTYGKDFTLNSSGNVEWITGEEKTNEPSTYTVSYSKTTTKSYGISGEKNSSTNPDVTNDQFTELQEKYAEAYKVNHGTSSTLSTVTLIDGDGVLRTYVDPEDPGLFTMSAGGQDYVYGRDYVLRVDDSGTGYSIQWLVEDGGTIADADTVVATYAAHKNISTSSWKAAPADNTEYNFGFSYTTTKDMTGTVSSSATNKSLSTVLGESLRSSEYSSVVISSGSKTYTEGKDYVINSSGTIQWLNQNSTTTTAYKASYTFSNNESSSVSVQKLNSNGINTISGFLSINAAGTKTFTDGSYTYIDEEEGKAAFTLTDSSGNIYEYGKDYALRYSTSSTGAKLLTVVRAKEGYNWPSSLTNRDSSTSMPQTGLTLTYNNTAERVIDSSATLEDALGFIPSDWSKLTLSDADGNSYVENTDYTIDTTTGAITWLNTNTGPQHPASDVEYSLIYDAYGAIDTAGTYAGSDTEVSITVDSGYGNIGGTTLSYEQILSDTGLRTSSSASDVASVFAENFTLSNGSTTYTYGTDYTIIQGDKDDASGEHAVKIQWINAPASGTEFTLSYSGRADETADFSVERSYTDAVQTGSSGISPLYSYFDGGTSTITQGSRTFYEGIDYEIVKIPSTVTDDYGNAIMNAAVEWKTGTKSEWYYPNPSENSQYTINLTTKNGSSLSFSAVRNSSDSFDLREKGFTSVNGSITSISYKGSSTHTYDLTDTSTDEDGRTPAQNMARQIGLNVTNSSNGGLRTFNFNWVVPERTANADLPGTGEEFKVEYTYNANTFTLSDDSDGKLLAAFELDQKDSEHYMAAQNAELELDGETITRESNDIGESYDNELIKGMTIHLKGTGEVSLDVAHDAQKAVESIQTFVDTYNELMSWMNTRMTEKQVDKDTAATIDSDDFRMRWGLLHGNSLLRNTKTQMRSIVSQNFTFSFTQRSSAEEIYGTMSHNGLRNDATLRLRIANKFVDVSILPTDTLQDIVNKINDDSEDGPMHDIYYDDEGNKLQQPLLRASIENDRLVINSTGNDPVTMSGTSAMNVLKMNYTYKGLYQIGIATTSTDYGKSGELEFDANEFMEALEDNPNEVQELMLMFAQEFDTWTKSMLTTSASGETSGTLTRQIEDLDNQIKTIDEYLEKYQERLDKQEENLRTKYANTETSLAKLTQQANSIAAILNQLNGYTNNNNNSSSN